MSDREFEGRVALITGGSRGLGRAIAIDLARMGASIALNYRANELAAREVEQQIRDEGGEARTFRADVGDADAVRAMCGEVEEGLGAVDLLVTSAGIGVDNDSVHDSTLEDWRHTMVTNVDGTYLPLMAVKNAMCERGYGRIVCMASVAGLRERPNLFAYSVSKAAVIALVRSAAPALGPKVRINCVAPGLIETDMTADVEPAWRQSVLDEQAIDRFGVPEDIAGATCFLLSDRASFMTGQTIVVDGGRVMLP